MAYVDPGRALVTLRGRKLELLWVPGLLYAGGREGCLFVDCSFYRCFRGLDESLARVLLTLRLRGDVRLTSAPPIRAPTCAKGSCEELSSSELGELEARALALAEGELEAPNPLRLMLAHFLSPHRWVIGSTEHIERGVAQRVAASIVLEKVREIRRFMRGLRPLEAFLLYAWSEDGVYVVFGDKPVRNPLVERLLREGAGPCFRDLLTF